MKNHHLENICFPNTSKKFNMEPERSWLEDYFCLLGRQLFRGELLNSRSVDVCKPKKTKGIFLYHSLKDKPVVG